MSRASRQRETEESIRRTVAEHGCTLVALERLGGGHCRAHFTDPTGKTYSVVYAFSPRSSGGPAFARQAIQRALRLAADSSGPTLSLQTRAKTRRGLQETMRSGIYG